MEYNFFAHKDGVAMECGPAFSLAETLTCGQFFRYKPEDGAFTIVAGERLLRLRQEGSVILCSGADLDEFAGFWARFFDLDTNYEAIRNKLSADDGALREAAGFAPGIRLLNQDPWECLLCFIISQNNRIPMIMQTVENISRRFGKKISDTEYFSVPEAETLAETSEEELRACKAGFRAGYILDAARRAASGEIDLYNTTGLDTGELREYLTSIRGVGVKIADCVMLFSMGRRDVFPTDVWVKRGVQRMYFNGAEMPLKEIQAFARERYGELAGYAQQYIYHYARLNKLI